MLDSEDLARFIARHGIRARVIPLPVRTATVHAAAEAMGTTPEQIVKTLLFLIDGRPHLAIAGGLGKVKRRALALHAKVSRRRVVLAGADTVLSTTGYPVGAVPPFGHVSLLPTFMDRRLFQFDEVYAGGGSLQALIRVAPAEIQRVTHAVKLDLLSAGDAYGEGGVGQAG